MSDGVETVAPATWTEPSTASSTMAEPGRAGAHCLLVELVAGDELRARRRSIPSSLTSESLSSQQ